MAMVQTTMTLIVFALSVISLLIVLWAVYLSRRNSLGGDIGNVLAFLVFGYVIAAVASVLIAMQLTGWIPVDIVTAPTIGFLSLLAAVIIFTNLNKIRKLVKGGPVNA